MSSMVTKVTSRQVGQRMVAGGDKTCSVIWLRAVAELLQAHRLDVPKLFAESGMVIDMLHGAPGRFASDKVSTLWGLAARHSNNPAIALTIPELARPAAFGVVSYSMLSCENLKAGLIRLSQYMSVVSEAATFSIREAPEGYWLQLDVQPEQQDVPRQRIEFDWLTILAFCKWATGREIRPLAMEWQAGDPANPDPHKAVFHCSMTFGCAANRVLLSRSDILATLPTWDDHLSELHDSLARDQLALLQPPSMSDRVRKLIDLGLRHGVPSKSDVAQMLCMSERTLQRRLDGEGTTFKSLIDIARRDLADSLLRRPHVSLDDLAVAMGFADESAMYRACRRWFGMTPGEYRLHVVTPRGASPQRLERPLFHEQSMQQDSRKGSAAPSKSVHTAP